MANFDITSAAVPATIQYNAADNLQTCQGTRDFDVKVPAGTTKWVEISITSIFCKINGASTPVAEAITADKQYVLVIEGDNTTTTQTDTITTTVRQVDANGQVDVVDNFVRQHSGAIC